MNSNREHAVLHRMVMDSHVCPWGVRALHLLRSRGYTVEDNHLRTREETDAFKAQHGVKTTPQVFIDGQRIGGYDDLRRFLGLRVRDPKATTYAPVIAVFTATAILAGALSWSVLGSVLTLQALAWFISFSMVVLAVLKLRDLESFSTMFLGYDLLAQRWPPYGRIYPFAELGAGVLMAAGALTWLSAPVALFIGGVGAVSVFKAVYLDRRELKCACVGGDSNVPLGFVSLSENLLMIAMAAWMLAAPMHHRPLFEAQASHAPAAAGHANSGRAASASSAAYMAGMDKMHRDMAAPMSGDADRDFAAMMIPHHRGAIDMARVELAYGKDARLRAMSRDIIEAQEGEIAVLETWLRARPSAEDRGARRAR
jgi:glutaredoxin